MGRYSDLLYAQPSFLEGLGRLSDFSGALDWYNYSTTEQEADRLAIASDWYAIGDDLRSAVSISAKAHNVEIRRVDSTAA